MFLDINECELNIMCDYYCVNILGSYYCICREGYKIYGVIYCVGKIMFLNGFSSFYFIILVIIINLFFKNFFR